MTTLQLGKITAIHGDCMDYMATLPEMRMFFVVELKKIMGFPADYVLIGTQADQKKFIGNAVVVEMAQAMCEALAGKLIELGRKAA